MGARGGLGVFLVVALLLAGCGGKHETTPVVGYAIAGGPLVGAKVAFLDANGKQIGEAASPTSRHGIFTARLSLPSTFTVVATGGEDRGKPFTRPLRAEVEKYAGHVIDVNPATTVESLVRQRGKLSRGDAVRRVRRYLELPAGADYARGARLTDRYVSTQRLVDEAGLDQAATDVLAGKRRSFAALHRSLAGPGDELAEDAEESAVDSVLGGMKEKAGGAAGSWVMGQLLTAVGSNANPDSAALQQIQSELQQLDSDFAQFLTAFDEIQAGLDAIQYNQAVGDLYDWVQDNSIDDMFDTYETWATDILDEGPGSADAKNAQASFEAKIAGAKTTQGQVLGVDNLIANFMNIGINVGGQGVGSNVALTDWANKLPLTVRYWTPDTQADYRSAFDYWAEVEAELAPMIEDYATANNVALPGDPVTVDGFLPDQQGDSAIETAAAFATWRRSANLDGMQPIPDGYVVDAATHTMWPANLGRGITANTITWLDANAQYVENGFAGAGLASGYDWTLPSIADFDNLVSAYGSYQGSGFSWTNPPQANVATYLASNGFEYVFEYFWVSDDPEDTTTVSNASSTYPVTALMRESFSMRDGSVTEECWAYLNKGESYPSPPPYCGDDTEVDPVSLTAVAHLDETPDSWWASPPGS